MRILQALHPVYMPHEWPKNGDTSMAILLCEGLKKAAPDLTIDVTCNLPADKDQDYINKYKALHGIDNIINTNLGTRDYQRKAAEIIWQLVPQYDLVHFHTAVPFLPYIGLVAKSGVPTIFTLHTDPLVRTFFVNAKHFLEFANIENARAVAVGDTHKGKILKTLRKYLKVEPPVSMIKNGVPIYDRPALSWTEKDIDVIIVGRMDQSKNILPALKHSKEILPNGRIVYIGARSSFYGRFNRVSLSEEIEKFIVDNNIEHYTSMPNAELRAMINRSRVLLTLSELECGPMVVKEAQTEGTPVIAFDIPVMREFIVKDFTGVLLEPGRSRWKNLTKKLHQAFHVTARNLDPFAIRDYGVRNYDINGTAMEYLKMYYELKFKYGNNERALIVPPARKRSSSSTPRKPRVPKVLVNPQDPTKPDYLRPWDYQYPVPYDRFWRPGSNGSKVHLLIQNNSLTVDEIISGTGLTKNQVLSILTPYKKETYKKFGFELCGDFDTKLSIVTHYAPPAQSEINPDAALEVEGNLQPVN